MLARLFPRSADNTYRGNRAALWLFALLALSKIAMGLNCIVNGHSVLTSADGVPLDTFPPAAAQTDLAHFALWGLCQLIFGLLGVLALVRYRALVPLTLALFLFELASRKLILLYVPVAKVGTPPGYYFNIGLFVLMLVGLALSLAGRRDARPLE